MKRLVLLRHGQTVWNAERRGQGHVDVPLDEVGHLQAKAAAVVLAGYGATCLWSSDLGRARQTAQHLAEVTALTPTYDHRLREYALGERTGLLLPEFATRFPDEYAAAQSGRLVPVPGGETTGAVLTRFRAALVDLTSALPEGGTAIVVSHGAALKVALVDLLGLPCDAEASLHTQDNCGWSVVTSDEAGESPHWRLSAYNMTAPDPDFASGPGVG